MKATGNCYENAARYILDEDRESDLTLVHCIVTGTGGDVEGVEYGHAFLILETTREISYQESPTKEIKEWDMPTQVAIDVTRDIDEPMVLPLGLYCGIGKVRNEIHYTREDVRKMVLEHEHFGPWDDSVQTEADRRAQESES
jgi:hypothetical protein